MAVIYKKLGEIADISSGGTPKRTNPAYWKNGNIPWVKISDIKGKYLEKTEEFITEEGLNNSSAKLFKKGTLLYTIFATIGECAILNIDASTNQAIAGINVKSEKVLTEYLYYFLKSIKNTVVNTGRGVAQNNINLSILKNIDVPLPEIEVQKKIINLLNKSNELVKKRKAQIEALDQLTQSVFLEMFGDPLANSKGWPTVKLKDYICKITKINLKQNKDIIKYIDISSIDNYKNKITSYKEYIGSEAPSRAQQVVQKGDILISTVRPNLKNVAMVQDNFENLICSTGFCVIRCTDKLNNNFIFHLVKSDSFTKNLVRKTTGANYPAVKNSDIYDEIIIYPPIDLQEKFSNITKQIEEKKTFLENSLSYQEKLFNSILQKAFNGELFIEEKVSNL